MTLILKLAHTDCVIIVLKETKRNIEKTQDKVEGFKTEPEFMKRIKQEF